jgi:rhodanese-related sulfurtransferase
MENLQDTVVNAKDRMPDVTPTPPAFHSQATAHELKSRLNWGEPGLTIIDVRDRAAFNQCHIRGAMNMPLNRLAEMARTSLQPSRDIYVYGGGDDEISTGVDRLRQAGFNRVAKLQGGLNAWQEINGPVDGPETDGPPGAGAYNVVSRLQDFAEEKEKERRMK